MSSTLIASIHIWSVMLFVILYLVKTVLLFFNQPMLDKFTKITKVPEMIISTLFLVSGVWLFVLLGGIKTMHFVKLAMVFIAIPVAIIGFKKRKKGLALFSFLLIVCAYGVAEMSKNKPFIKANVQMMNDDQSPRSNGQRVYFENCAFCHGNDGKKAYRDAKNLNMTGLSETDLQTFIHDGVKGKMPAYGTVLTQQEIADVALYVSTMKNEPAPVVH
jgi:mono/diheme cytochrome c family protein